MGCQPPARVLLLPVACRDGVPTLPVFSTSGGCWPARDALKAVRICTLPKFATYNSMAYRAHLATQPLPGSKALPATCCCIFLSYVDSLNFQKHEGCAYTFSYIAHVHLFSHGHSAL